MALKRILYFIEGITPTEAEEKAALSCGSTIFRSLQSYTDGDFIENCDGVAGKVPQRYLEKYKRADAPKEEPKKEPVNETKKVPEVPPPTPPPPPPPPPPAPSGAAPAPWSTPS